jgi:hypothetical protein
MATGHRVYSDLFDLSNFVRQVAVYQGKNLLIDALREYFRQDLFYQYRTDSFGFPLTPDLTEMPPDIQDQRSTRILIGDTYRYETRFLPAIGIKHTSSRTYHISMNQNFYTTKYRLDLILDGYGNESYIRTPTHHVIAGAWDNSFEVTIATEAIPDREELVDIVASFLIGKARQELTEAGLFIRNVSIGGEREEEWANDKVYIQTISVETYSEWRREIPIENIIEIINFCFKYGLFSADRFVTRKTFVDLNDIGD